MVHLSCPAASSGATMSMQDHPPEVVDNQHKAKKKKPTPIKTNFSAFCGENLLEGSSAVSGTWDSPHQDRYFIGGSFASSRRLGHFGKAKGPPSNYRPATVGHGSLVRGYHQGYDVLASPHSEWSSPSPRRLSLMSKATSTGILSPRVAGPQGSAFWRPPFSPFTQSPRPPPYKQASSPFPTSCPGLGCTRRLWEAASKRCPSSPISPSSSCFPPGRGTVKAESARPCSPYVAEKEDPNPCGMKRNADLAPACPGSSPAAWARRACYVSEKGNLDKLHTRKDTLGVISKPDSPRRYRNTELELEMPVSYHWSPEFVRY